MMISWRIR